jgi:hypothetical protein
LKAILAFGRVVIHIFYAQFLRSPSAKTAHKRIENTLLPQAKDHQESTTA